MTGILLLVVVGAETCLAPYGADVLLKEPDVRHGNVICECKREPSRNHLNK